MVGCSLWPTNNLATPWPTNYLSTAIVLTMTALSPPLQTPTFSENTLITPDVMPTAVLTPDVTYENNQQKTTSVPFNQKTPSPTPTPASPEAIIQIIFPGSYSKLISPIKIEAYAQPGADNRIHIELIGESGQIISKETRIYTNLSRLWAPVNLELSFKLKNIVEYARLQIRTEDQFQRVIALSPVHLLLQSEGINRIYPNTILIDRCKVQSPKHNEIISGGLLIIEGEFLPFNDQPILFDLIAESGQIVSSKSIHLDSESWNRFSSFKIDLPYDVKTKTPVRLTISQNDDRIPGKLYVFSQLLFIGP